MNQNSEIQRYYYSLRSQIKLYAVIAVIGIVTLYYASVLHDRTAGIFLMIMSSMYPLIILIGVLQTIKSLNYADLESSVLSLRHLGVLHKKIHWADVTSVSKVTINKTDFLGIAYRTGYKNHDWRRHYQQKNFGCDYLLREGYSKAGCSLLKMTRKSYAAFTADDVSKLANTWEQSGSAVTTQIKQSFKVSDLWGRPNSLVWLSISVICEWMSKAVKPHSHVLSSLLDLLSFIAIGFFGIKLVRYRRVIRTDQKKSNIKKSND
jgi:hypothetical protein